MTRARDSLPVYARQGTGKEKTPAGLMRNLLQDSSLRGWLSSRSARGSQTSMDIFGATSPPYPSASRTAQWLDIPAVTGLHTRLSASPVDTYAKCPLQFQLHQWSD